MGMIIGYEKEKEIIRQLREMLHKAENYREHGIRIPRGLLLAGKPGVGKTVLARSLVDEGIHLVELRAATCCNSEASEAVKEVFRQAKSQKPSVLLLDELDKIAGCSSSFFMEDNDKVMKTLLQELDALSDDDVVLVVATCNDLNMIGDALVRPGRFDRTLILETPDEETRKCILKAYFERIKIPCTLDYEYLARITYGYTGAKLECLVNEAGILGMEKEEPSVTQEDIYAVINRLDFHSTEKNVVSDKEQLRRIAVHEAGHVLCALYLTPNCLFGASILPQGETQGHIRFIREENVLQSMSEIEREATVILAGHVAERIEFGEYLTGSSSDIEKATARVHYLTSREAAYGYDYVTALLYKGQFSLSSDSVKSRAAEKVAERMAAIDKYAEGILTEHRDVFTAVVNALMEKQILTRDELMTIKETMESKSAA